MSDKSLAEVLSERENREKKAKHVCREIKSEFGKSPEEKLFFAIVERAIYDACVDGYYGARSYLSGYIPHAEMCGVDSDWIRRVIKKVGLEC